MTPKILIIDDDPDIIEIATLILGTQDYEVTSARNGEDGLARLRESKPDLIILDLLMPKMNGFDVYKELHTSSWAEYQDIPILIFSSVDEAASRQRYELETGCSIVFGDYVEKPLVPAVLLTKVAELLGLPPLKD
jgi:CheY-like chemotaxis protein